MSAVSLQDDKVSDTRDSSIELKWPKEPHPTLVRWGRVYSLDLFSCPASPHSSTRNRWSSKTANTATATFIIALTPHVLCRNEILGATRRNVVVCLCKHHCRRELSCLF